VVVKTQLFRHGDQGLISRDLEVLNFAAGAHGGYIPKRSFLDPFDLLLSFLEKCIESSRVGRFLLTAKRLQNFV